MNASVTSGSRPAGEPRLRSDLGVWFDEGGAFIIEDPVRSQFHRVGRAEYALLSRLDGTTMMAEAARQAAQSTKGTPLASGQLETFVQWLAATNLLAGGTPAAPQKPPALSNPCYVKIPLTAGGRLLDHLTVALGWLFFWPALIVIALATLLAAGQVALHWSAFTVFAERILCPDQHLLLAACWLLLKLAHELGHGIASRRFGGDVREFGIAIIFLVPVPYTDVTPSWRCTRRERMAIAAAGMYFEWIIALFAIAIWSATSSVQLQQICIYVVGLATLTTVLFNANPLCRMDGYYIVSDFLGLQNLAAQGQRISRAWLSWLLLGQAPADATSEKHRLSIGCYGLLTRLWRALSLATMAIVVLLVYEGLGVLLLGSVLLAWHLQARATSAARPTASSSRPSFLAASGIRFVLIATFLGLALWLVPWPGGITAPGVVESVERHVVRSPCDAQVTKILVASGDRIAAGQEIAHLTSDKLVLELAELESALAQGEVKQRSQRTKKQLGDWQVEEHRQETLTERIAECRQKLDNLTLRAPIAGRVIARRIADLPGSYLAEGAEVCTVVTDEQEFRILMAERDLAAFTSQLGQEVEVAISGHVARGVLERLEPAATTTLTDTTLGANAGGPLPVVPEPNAGWRLKEPRIVGHVRLAAPDAGQLLAGQRGYVSIAPRHYSFAQRAASGLQSWFDKLSAQARQQTSPSRPPAQP